MNRIQNVSLSTFSVWGLGFLLLLGTGCSPQQQQSLVEPIHSEDEYRDINSSMDVYEPEEPTDKPLSAMHFKRQAFSYTVPDSQWVLVSDPSNPLQPLEFFLPVEGMRFSIAVETLQENQGARLSERVQGEKQRLERESSEVVISTSHPLEISGLEGLTYEVAVKKAGKEIHQKGFKAQASPFLFDLQLISHDSILSSQHLQKLWKQALSGLTIDSQIVQQNQETLSQASLQQFEDPQQGFQWKVQDTLWHEWKGSLGRETEATLGLMDLEQNVSAMIYAMRTQPQEINPEDLFQVFLLRLGLDPTSPSLQVKRQRGQTLRYDFETIHMVHEYDFLYQGVFYYREGYGVMLTTWTQNAFKQRYQKSMQQAIEGLKLTGTLPSQIEARKNARLLNEVGLIRLAQDQPLVALAFFEKANRLDPEEPLYLINCGFIYQLKNLYGPGTTHFQSQMGLVRKSGKLLHILGEMYESLRDYGQALEYYEQAYRYMPNDVELVINLSDAFWGVGQRTQSLQVVANLYQKQPSTRLGVYYARTLMGLEQYAEAVDVLYGVQDRFGLSRDLGLVLLDALTFLQRHQEALSISEELMLMIPKDGEILTARGKSQFYLHQYQAAEKTLKKALQINPSNEEAKSFLSASQAFLGKADNQAIKTSIKPVSPLPSDIKKLLHPQAKQSAQKEKQPALVHWQEEVLSIRKNMSWTRTEQMLVEILSPAGLGLFREFSYSFLPGYDRIYVNALNVYGADGSLKSSWDIKRAYITYFTEEGSDHEAQWAHLPIHELEVGDFVQLQISRTALAKSDAVPFTHHICSRKIPVGHDIFRVEADTNQILVEEYGAVERQTLEHGLEWTLDQPVTIRKEIFMPIYRDFGSGILVAGKQTWQQVGRDYQNLIKHQIKSSIPVREKAFELFGNRSKNQEAIFQAADWIRHNIHYRDVRFGGHSLIPAQALTTLTNRMGDCKDQSLLLKEILAVMDIPSQLALIHLEEPGYEALPTIQQFNHMILHIPAGKNWGELWIDPTDQAGSRRPIPLDLEGKVSLIIQGDSSYVTVTPILEKNQEHQAHLHHTIVIQKNGSAEFRDSLALYGKFASLLRNEMLKRDQRERQRYLMDWLIQQIPDATLTQMKLENTQQFDRPLILVMTSHSQSYFRRGLEIQGPLPNLWEQSFMRLPKIRKRHHPIRLPHETQFISEWTILGPQDEHLKIQTVSKPNQDSYTNLELYTSTHLDHGHHIQVNWRTYATYADASEYDAIRKEWNQILKLTQPYVGSAE